jgi:hypothetical protein
MGITDRFGGTKCQARLRMICWGRRSRTTRQKATTHGTKNTAPLRGVPQPSLHRIPHAEGARRGIRGCQIVALCDNVRLRPSGQDAKLKHGQYISQSLCQGFKALCYAGPQVAWVTESTTGASVESSRRPWFSSNSRSDVSGIVSPPTITTARRVFSATARSSPRLKRSGLRGKKATPRSRPVRSSTASPKAESRSRTSRPWGFMTSRCSSSSASSRRT